MSTKLVGIGSVFLGLGREEDTGLVAVRDEVGPWAPCDTDENLRTPPGPGSPGNRPLGEDLDLRLGWERFEKLVLDVTRHTPGLRGMRFRRYGVQGQAQHGIDLVGRDPDGAYVVVQCKDYQSFTAAHLRAAVTTFVSGRLPFDATHLIVATSACTQATQIVDEHFALQDEYPQLTLELWGAEKINYHLRFYADVVARFWTRETAATFCTAAPPPGVPAPPPDRQSQAERILVGPLETVDVAPKLREAEAQRESRPEESARLYGELAERLVTAGFRGHGAVLRDRQVAALRAAGCSMQAVVVTVHLVVDALDRGDRDEARRLQGRLTKIFTEAGGTTGGEATQASRHAEPATAAVDYIVDPLGRPEPFLAALSCPGAEDMPHHPRLVLLLAEGIAAGRPGHINEIDDLLRFAVERLGAAQWDEIGVRLRLVLAEYDQEVRRALLSAARQHRVPGRMAALINAREARRRMLESRAEEALESWRDAVQNGIHEGLTDDAADWLYAVRAVNLQFGPWTLAIDEEHHLARALRHTGADRLLDRARQPSDQARAAALAQRPIEAVLAARQWLTDAMITGNWASEIEAARFLGELYRDNAEPEAAAELLARSGSAKELVDLAERVGDELIPVHLDRQEPWWTSDARIALIVAQEDLLPNHDAANLLDELTDMAQRGRAGELVESTVRGGLTDRATAGACALAHRGTPEQARAVLDLLTADVPREPNQFRSSDGPHAAACVEIAVAHPALAVPALTRLFDLARYGVDKAIRVTVDDRVVHMVRGGPRDEGPLLPVLTAEQLGALRVSALRLAENQSPVTHVLRHELAPDEPAAQEAARQAGDRILSRPEPIPGQVTYGSTMVTDAYLAGLLNEPDRLACIEKLLDVAEDAREAAMNRQDALTAATNLVIDVAPAVRTSVFPRSVPFVAGDRDGSAYDDEVTNPPHPLSSYRTFMGTATLRGHGLQLAGAAARDDEDRRWVRDQAVDLLRSGEDTLAHRAARALASMPAAITHDLDAGLLAAHPHVNVRQLSAHICMSQPERYRTTALHLAKDRNPRVRRVLADAAARVHADDATKVAELIRVLATDVRHSVRATACASLPVQGAGSSEPLVEVLAP